MIKVVWAFLLLVGCAASAPVREGRSWSQSTASGWDQVVALAHLEKRAAPPQTEALFAALEAYERLPDATKQALEDAWDTQGKTLFADLAPQVSPIVEALEPWVQAAIEAPWPPASSAWLGGAPCLAHLRRHTLALLGTGRLLLMMAHDRTDDPRAQAAARLAAELQHGPLLAAMIGSTLWQDVADWGLTRQVAAPRAWTQAAPEPANLPAIFAREWVCAYGLAQRELTGRETPEELADYLGSAAQGPVVHTVTQELSFVRHYVAQTLLPLSDEQLDWEGWLTLAEFRIPATQPGVLLRILRVNGQPVVEASAAAARAQKRWVNTKMPAPQERWSEL